MSADNTVAVGRFLSEDGQYTYRVIHAQAIENCDLDDSYPPKLIEAFRVQYYGKSEVFTDVRKAYREAIKLYEGYVFVEYGIQEINYDEPFPTMTTDEANEIIEDYFS